MPLLHSHSAYPYSSSLGKHWISTFSGRVSLNVNISQKREYDHLLSRCQRKSKDILVSESFFWQT